MNCGVVTSAKIISSSHGPTIRSDCSNFLIQGQNREHQLELAQFLNQLGCSKCLTPEEVCTYSHEHVMTMCRFPHADQHSFAAAVQKHNLVQAPYFPSTVFTAESRAGN